MTRTGETASLLKRLMGHEWVVDTKNCLQHTATVVDYLARYTRRIAISNARIEAVDDHGVTLRYKDYRHGGRNRTMTLDGAEFVRRFLLHVLPKGLMRVRHYGFLANRCRRRRLAQIGQALAAAEPEANSDDHGPTPAVVPCPHCRDTVLQVRAVLPPRMWPARPPNQRRRIRFRF